MAKDLEVAIVFADVVGSTQLYDKFGDTKASETVALCLDVMKDATYQFNGTVIKTIGDEVMSTFESVARRMTVSRFQFASAATMGRLSRSRMISSVQQCIRRIA
jgi:class 3 adenylate cyclase